MLITWSRSGLFLLLYVCIFKPVWKCLWIPIPAINLFHCFCLIFTRVFQIFWVPEILPFPRTSMWENHDRGVLAQPDVIHKATEPPCWAAPVSSSSPEQRQPVPSPWCWKIPELPMLLGCPGTSCELLCIPRSPAAKRNFRVIINCLKNFESCCWRAKCSASELKGSCSASFHLLSVLENN